MRIYENPDFIPRYPQVITDIERIKTPVGHLSVLWCIPCVWAIYWINRQILCNIEFVSACHNYGLHNTEWYSSIQSIIYPRNQLVGEIRCFSLLLSKRSHDNFCLISSFLVITMCDLVEKGNQLTTEKPMVAFLLLSSEHCLTRWGQVSPTRNAGLLFSTFTCAGNQASPYHWGIPGGQREAQGCELGILPEGSRHSTKV